MPEQADQPQPSISLCLIVTMSDAEHGRLLAHTTRLAELDPPADSPAGVALQLLAYIVEQYELKRYPMHEMPVLPGAAWPLATVRVTCVDPTGGSEPTGENMVG